MIRFTFFQVALIAVAVAIALASAGCSHLWPTPRLSVESAEPCLTPDTNDPQGPSALSASTPDKGAPANPDEIPLFAANSPFDVEYKPPVLKDGKRLWASSLLWEKAPDLVVEKWLTDRPDTYGKYILIEFWATWCSPCRRSIPLLNRLHEKYGEDLIVIGVSDETEEDVRALKEPKIDYFSAIDTQARMKKQVGVFGIPHVIILEPGGHVVWEGFPLLKDYELTGEIVERILRVGRKLKEQAASGM